jgi:hypothetical protein
MNWYSDCCMRTQQFRLETGYVDVTEIYQRVYVSMCNHTDSES